jgi:hypothetical protein
MTSFLDNTPQIPAYIVSTGLFTPLPPRLSTWVQTMVVLTSL